MSKLEIWLLFGWSCITTILFFGSLVGVCHEYQSTAREAIKAGLSQCIPKDHITTIWTKNCDQ